MARSKALKEAQERYDAKRPKPITVRPNWEEQERLEAQMLEGEKPAAALKRLSGITRQGKTKA